MEVMKDKIQQHSTQPREDPHTGRSLLFDSIEYARVRLDKVEEQLEKHGQTITYMYNYFKPGTRPSANPDAVPVGQYRSKSRTPYDPNPSRPNPTSSSSTTQ